MKKQDIVTLAKGDFLLATAHCLPADEFYKWYKFRRQIALALVDISKDESALREQCGIPQGKTDVPQDAAARFMEVRKKLLDENIAIDISSRIPFKYYKEIYDENKTEGRDIFASAKVEMLVIDNLFEP